MCRTSERRNITITKELLRNFPINSDASPSEFIRHYWQHYNDEYESNNSTNGTIFENLVILSLARNGINPIYYQTELTYVPSAIFDVFLFSEELSVAISIKTTLRERWKQADLEALAIKQVHKSAQCFVVTLSHNEVSARRRNDSTYAGLDRFILADTTEFDDLINDLSERDFSIAGSFPVVKTDDRFFTPDSINRLFGLDS